MIVSLQYCQSPESDNVKARLPDLDVSTAVVLGPNAQNILTTPNTQHCSTDFFTGFQKLVTDNDQEQILPVAISDTLLQSNDPLPAPLVGLVLPDRPDPLFEYVVVGYTREE